MNDRGKPFSGHLPPPDGRECVMAVMGSVARTGEWLPPEELTATAGLGSVSLDFRKADLPPGVTTVKALAFMGSVVITIPAELEVELNGSSFLGSIELRSGRKGVRKLVAGWMGRGRQEPHQPDHESEAPLLCIRGTAVLGSIVVKVV